MKFKIPAHNIIILWAGILNFKFRIVFWNIFFGDWEIWKTNRTFWKKATFSSGKILVLICQTYQIFYLQSRVLLMFDIFRWLVILGQPLKFMIDVTEEVLSKFFRRVKDFIHLYFHKVQKIIKYVLKYGSGEKGSWFCRCSILLGFVMSKNLRGLWFYFLIKVQNATSLVFLT